MTLSHSLRRFLAHRIKYLSNAAYRYKQKELERLKSLPRYQLTHTNLAGKKLEVPDAASFLFMYQEIFERQVYRFPSDHPAPYIIDAGANIGLSVLYFKQLFPDAQIVAFEADPDIFDILEKNLRGFELRDVSIVNKALWCTETTIHFRKEGADAGCIVTSGSDSTVAVDTVRLAPFLNKTVDLLKIDIEGAEYTVISHSAPQLKNVKRIFIEYHSYLDQSQNLPELLSILKDAGFRLNINSPGLISSRPFEKIEVYNNMDMQLNIYAYRNE